MIGLPAIQKKVAGLLPNVPESASASEKMIWRTPAINLDKMEREYLITLASPGMERQDFSIKVHYPCLTISARKCLQGVAAVHSVCEFDFSGWERKLELPDDADVVFTTAAYHNGELCLHIPRSTSATNDREELKIYVY